MYRRYVALGDSTTEGMDDPRPDGTYRGWADRLAERLAQDNPDLLYANLAIRGRRIAQVREEQLAAGARAASPTWRRSSRAERPAAPPLRPRGDGRRTSRRC